MEKVSNQIPRCLILYYCLLLYLQYSYGEKSNRKHAHSMDWEADVKTNHLPKVLRHINSRNESTTQLVFFPLADMVFISPCLHSLREFLHIGNINTTSLLHRKWSIHNKNNFYPSYYMLLI